MLKPNQQLPAQLTQTLLCLWAAGAISLLTSCSSTHIQASRTQAGLSAPPFHSVLVAAVDNRPDIRAQFESDMIYCLQQRKVVGVGSSDRFTLAELKGVGEELRKKCASAGAEALLLVRTTDRTTFETGPGYERLSGFGDIKTDVQLTATLYRLSDGAPLWTGVVDTILKEQYNSIVVLRKVAQAIVNSLAKDKVIP